MSRRFWDKLPKPFFVLAPMADVTDSVFRRVVAERGKPDVMFTEFVAADGLMHPLGRERLLVDLRYGEIERPIVAQIWGGKPENIEGAARLVRELGFDGVDINMGCPDRGVERQCGGASLMRNHDLAREVIKAALRGADPLPVSVKTRIGYNSVDPEWIKMLAGTGIAALTLHLRTRKEMSKVAAHWDLLPVLLGKSKISSLYPLCGGSDETEILDIPMRPGPDSTTPLIIGNGDVDSVQDGRDKVAAAGIDGAMLGRAIFGNPWLFSESGKPDWPEVFATMIYHCALFEEAYVGIKNFALMRKFFGAYVAGHHRASELKVELMKCGDTKSVEKVLGSFS
jgi:tRNA-dihydrouridine synthase